MNLVIYHNENCSKSRSALEIIREHQISPKVIDYKNEGLTVKQVVDLVELLKISPQEIIRDSELTELNEVATAISENPSLLQRPIVVAGDKAIIARPPEKVLELINSFK